MLTYSQVNLVRSWSGSVMLRSSMVWTSCWRTALFAARLRSANVRLRAHRFSDAVVAFSPLAWERGRESTISRRGPKEGANHSQLPTRPHVGEEAYPVLNGNSS